MSGAQERNARLISRLLKHGASHVSMAELVSEGQIIWSIGADQEVSKPCLHAEEFMSSAARNCRRANSVIARMRQGKAREDLDLMTALKKYVEDACAAIKEVDDELKRNGSSLDKLLFEIPGEATDDQMSWRNLIGRRDVIAHQLLTIDDDRVYREAERDFGLLEQFISRVYFGSGRGTQPLFRTEILDNLARIRRGDRPRIGNSIVFVFDDVVDGLVWVRMGVSETNKMVLGASRSMYMSMGSVEGMEDVKDEESLRKVVAVNEQGVFLDVEKGKAHTARRTKSATHSNVSLISRRDVDQSIERSRR